MLNATFFSGSTLHNKMFEEREEELLLTLLFSFGNEFAGDGMNFGSEEAFFVPFGKAGVRGGVLNK